MKVGEYKPIEKKIIDGEEHVIMGIVYRDLTSEEIADLEKQRKELEPVEPSLEDKVNALMSFMGLKGVWNGSVFEVVKEEMPIGDYVNPIPFTDGMNVEVGKFYKFADDNIWECIKAGMSSYTSEYFDIIN